MGPDSSLWANFPSRSRLIWDMSSTSFTNSRVVQEELARNVVLWKPFHDLIPNRNSNKKFSALCEIIISLKLNGRAKDFCAFLNDSNVASDSGMKELFTDIQKLEAQYAIMEF